MEVVAELMQRFDDLVGFLGERPFFHADAPSVADISTFGMLRTVEVSPIPVPEAARASRIVSSEPNLPVPNMRRDPNSRPAISSNPALKVFSWG